MPRFSTWVAAPTWSPKFVPGYLEVVPDLFMMDEVVELMVGRLGQLGW